MEESADIGPNFLTPTINNTMRRQIGIKNLPVHVLQMFLFPCFTSKEIFFLRGVSIEWADCLKVSWCQAVKEEMLKQVHSLDLLYEKETTSKVIDFKIRYLLQYGELMDNYFQHMNFDELGIILLAFNSPAARLLLLLTAMLIDATPFPKREEEIVENDYLKAVDFIRSQEFKMKVRIMCKFDSTPFISYEDLERISKWYQKLIPEEEVANLGKYDNVLIILSSIAKLICAFIEAAIEFGMCKHEVLLLRHRYKLAMGQIKDISQLWPKRKAFIEGAYKLFLFSQYITPKIFSLLNFLKQHGFEDLAQYLNFDYNLAKMEKSFNQKVDVAISFTTPPSNENDHNQETLLQNEIQNSIQFIQLPTQIQEENKNEAQVLKRMQIEIGLVPHFMKCSHFDMLLQKRIFLTDRYDRLSKVLEDAQLINKLDDNPYQIPSYPKEKEEAQEMAVKLYQDLTKGDSMNQWYNIFHTINWQLKKIDNVREKHTRSPAKPEPHVCIQNQIGDQSQSQEPHVCSCMQQRGLNALLFGEDDIDGENAYAQISDYFCSLTTVKYILECANIKEEIQMEIERNKNKETIEEGVQADMELVEEEKTISTQMVQCEVQTESEDFEQIDKLLMARSTINEILDQVAILTLNNQISPKSIDNATQNKLNEYLIP